MKTSTDKPNWDIVNLNFRAQQALDIVEKMTSDEVSVGTVGGGHTEERRTTTRDTQTLMLATGLIDGAVTKQIKNKGINELCQPSKKALILASLNGKGINDFRAKDIQQAIKRPLIFSSVGVDIKIDLGNTHIKTLDGGDFKRVNQDGTIDKLEPLLSIDRTEAQEKRVSDLFKQYLKPSTSAGQTSKDLPSTSGQRTREKTPPRGRTNSHS